MQKHFRVLIGSCVAIISALLVVGAVSHGIIRHVVQTSPLWIVIVLGIRRSPLTKWAILPCSSFWLLVMTAIWLDLLGWVGIVSGTFSPTEIAMPMVVGFASMAAIVSALGMRSVVRAWLGIGTTLLLLILQLSAFRLSFLPHIAHC